MEPFSSSSSSLSRQYETLNPSLYNPKTQNPKQSKITTLSRPFNNSPGQSAPESFYHPFYTNFDLNPGTGFTLPRARTLLDPSPTRYQDPTSPDILYLCRETLPVLLEHQSNLNMDHTDDDRPHGFPRGNERPNSRFNVPTPIHSWNQNPPKRKDLPLRVQVPDSDSEGGKRTRQDWQTRIMESERTLRRPTLTTNRNSGGSVSGLSPPISVISTSGSGTTFTEIGSGTGHYYSLPGSRTSEIESTGSLRADSGLGFLSGSNQSDQSSLTRHSTNSKTIALPPRENTSGLDSPVIYANINTPEPPPPPQQVPYCSGCKGVVPKMDTIPELSSLKADANFWNYHQNFHYPVQRNNSIGGFTLTGQDTRKVKKGLARFCSSHKIGLVVSTFSLLVTIGLVITLILMKKIGMMEPMR